VIVRLNVRTWGDGPRTALLLHGLSDDSQTWWRVAPVIAAQGFTVLAPDQRGHGLSPRAESYALADFAADLVETVPAGLDVALGHSLGGLVLGIAAPELRPRRAIFVDPPWSRGTHDFELVGELPSTADELPAHWTAEDVAVDLRSNSQLDPAVVRALKAELVALDVLPVPPAAVVGTAVLVPELDPALPVEAHAAVRAAGYEIHTQPSVRHVMHRDDLDGFLALLRPLLAVEGAAA
jgi:pimeloyl-ACP methyl ester carboxylesterase